MLTSVFNYFAAITILLPLCCSAQDVKPEEPTVVKPEESALIKPEEPAVVWKNKLELSYIQTSGNTENSTFAGKYVGKGEIHANRLFFNADMVFQSKDGEESANKSNIKARYERKFAKRLFLLFESKYQRDKYSGYEYRLTSGPGIGYDLFDREKLKLKTYGSFNYHYDSYSQGQDEADSYTAMQLNVDAESQLQDNLKIMNDFYYVFSTKEQEKYQVTNESGLSVKINSMISMGLSYMIQYDNEPPLATLEKVNTTFLSTLIFDF